MANGGRRSRGIACSGPEAIGLSSTLEVSMLAARFSASLSHLLPFLAFWAAVAPSASAIPSSGVFTVHDGNECGGSIRWQEDPTW